MGYKLGLCGQGDVQGLIKPQESVSNKPCVSYNAAAPNADSWLNPRSDEFNGVVDKCWSTLVYVRLRVATFGYPPLYRGRQTQEPEVDTGLRASVYTVSTGGRNAVNSRAFVMLGFTGPPPRDRKERLTQGPSDCSETTSSVKNEVRTAAIQGHKGARKQALAKVQLSLRARLDASNLRSMGHRVRISEPCECSGYTHSTEKRQLNIGEAGGQPAAPIATRRRGSQLLSTLELGVLKFSALTILGNPVFWHCVAIELYSEDEPRVLTNESDESEVDLSAISQSQELANMFLFAEYTRCSSIPQYGSCIIFEDLKPGKGVRTARLRMIGHDRQKGQFALETWNRKRYQEFATLFPP
ncbi:hypothetical protein DFH06DRAFT_1130730 [Mycena polygramma]|nr:hypothetical protein DFH06DRAFT_1130730 [Mycena polygramma]